MPIDLLRNTAGVVLAGGKSRRMGTDKRFLRFNGDTLLQHALSVFESLFEEILVVLAEPLPQSVLARHHLVTDLIPNCAALGGLYTGLALAKQPRVFVAACDMPFLNPSLIRYLVELGSEDIVIPDPAGNLQPMHAVYSKACLPYFKRMIEAKTLSIQEIIQQPGLKIRCVPKEDLQLIDPQLRSFLNLNTAEDVDLAKALLKQSNNS